MNFPLKRSSLLTESKFAVHAIWAASSNNTTTKLCLFLVRGTADRGSHPWYSVDQCYIMTKSSYSLELELNELIV